MNLIRIRDCRIVEARGYREGLILTSKGPIRSRTVGQKQIRTLTVTPITAGVGAALIHRS